jgi:hypothetical protein
MSSASPSSASNSLLVFVGGTGVAPLLLRSADVRAPVRGHDQRLHEAAAAVFDKAMRLRDRRIAQTDVDPILLVCDPEAPRGHRLAEALAPGAADAAAGLLVFDVRHEQLVALAGAHGEHVVARFNALGVLPGEAVFAFAINDLELELRVLRVAVSAPAPPAVEPPDAAPVPTVPGPADAAPTPEASPTDDAAPGA